MILFLSTQLSFAIRFILVGIGDYFNINIVRHSLQKSRQGRWLCFFFRVCR